MSGGRDKEHFSSILDLSLCRSGGRRRDRQEDQQTHVLLARTCSEWSLGHSSAWGETPQQRARHHSRLHIKTPPPGVDFGRKMSIGDADSVQLCVFLLQPAVHLVHLTLLSVTRCVPLDDTHTCINTQVVSLTEVYNLTNWKKRKRCEYQWPLSVWCTLSKAQPDVQSVSDISDFKFSEWFQKEEHMCRGRSLKVKNRHCVVCSALNAALKNTCIQPHNWSGEITIYHEP